MASLNTNIIEIKTKTYRTVEQHENNVSLKTVSTVINICKINNVKLQFGML